MNLCTPKWKDSLERDNFLAVQRMWWIPIGWLSRLQGILVVPSYSTCSFLCQSRKPCDQRRDYTQVSNSGKHPEYTHELTDRIWKAIGTNNLIDFVKKINHKYHAWMDAQDQYKHTYKSEVLAFDMTHEQNLYKKMCKLWTWIENLMNWRWRGKTFKTTCLMFCWCWCQLWMLS